MKRYKVVSIVSVVGFVITIWGLWTVWAQDDILPASPTPTPVGYVYMPIIAKEWAIPFTPTPTPLPTATPDPWTYFLTGYQDTKMKGIVTGSVRRTSMTDYWGTVVYPRGVFIVLFMDVINCDMESAYVSGINTFWMRDGLGPFFDMAGLSVQWAAEDEYDRIGVYEDLQPQFTYEMVFAFDVPPEGSYVFWYIPWGSEQAVAGERE